MHFPVLKEKKLARRGTSSQKVGNHWAWFPQTCLQGSSQMMAAATLGVTLGSSPSPLFGSWFFQWSSWALRQIICRRISAQPLHCENNPSCRCPAPWSFPRVTFHPIWDITCALESGVPLTGCDPHLFCEDSPVVDEQEEKKKSFSGTGIGCPSLFYLRNMHGFWIILYNISSLYLKLKYLNLYLKVSIKVS